MERTPDSPLPSNPSTSLALHECVDLRQHGMQCGEIEQRIGRLGAVTLSSDSMIGNALRLCGAR